MGRKNKYETHVKPYLADITRWYQDMTERQIAKKLGISVASFENYKIKYPELKECLKTGKETLVDDLKDSLRKKAKGFHYKETKRTYILIKDENGVEQISGEIKVEEAEKYAAPDTGAIHLLLKNLDEDWHNDDQATLKLKQEQLELAKQKAENADW